MPTRLDKWLWAARFFRTRSLATQAISGGKVKVNGDSAKPSRDVQVGDEIAVRSGVYQKVVTVEQVTGKRGSASIAAELYTETAESLAARETLALQLREERNRSQAPVGRPSKRDRREIRKLRGR